MIKYHKSANNNLIAELTDIDYVISGVQEALDLIGDIGLSDCSRLIIREENLHDNFFHLKTGLAGDVLQKFSNYKVRLAIIGNFQKYKSKPFQDFIRESNNGNLIFFTDNLDSALKRMNLI